MTTQQVEPDVQAWREQEQRQRKANRKKKGSVLAVAAISLMAAACTQNEPPTVAANEPPTVAANEPPTVTAACTQNEPPKESPDYLLDLDTGTKTPLPENIVGAGYEATQYAASPDGSTLAYVVPSDNGTSQIFAADLDGSRVRQVTYDPVGACWPAWSPDGAMIAYAGYGSRDVRNFFVLDVATGETSRITDETRDVWDSQFTPDGSSLLYTGGTDQVPELRTVPVAGGQSTLLIGPGDGLDGAGNGSLSPDGSLVTFQGGGFPISGKPTLHCGPCRLVANADGNERRVIPGYVSNPAGTWSPDGSRIVDLRCRRLPESAENCEPPDGIIVVDIATGDASPLLALGIGAIWLDDHTLLIDV